VIELDAVLIQVKLSASVLTCGQMPRRMFSIELLEPRVLVAVSLDMLPSPINRVDAFGYNKASIAV